MKNIVTVNNQQYEIESNVLLSQEQMKEYILQKIGTGNIETLAPTCPGAKYVGQTITLTSTPTGGTAPYTVTFKRNGIDLPNGSFTNVPEGTPKTMPYTLVDGDKPSVIISVYITDNCPTGAKNNTEQCTITVGTCNIPSCGFTVA